MFQSPSLRGSGRFGKRRKRGRGAPKSFNPLHCGAVVASGMGGPGRPHGQEAVSIPFIAGQWSLRTSSRRTRPSAAWFQSPSLRGSGRFLLTAAQQALPPDGFNPLHCGAVVASRPGRPGRAGRLGVSIPFIAGQWSLHAHQRVAPRDSRLFQSPSLRGSGRFVRVGGFVLVSVLVFQSPSLRGSGRFRLSQRWRWSPPLRFNPLHCGAVVASS